MVCHTIVRTEEVGLHFLNHVSYTVMNYTEVNSGNMYAVFSDLIHAI